MSQGRIKFTLKWTMNGAFVKRKPELSARQLKVHIFASVQVCSQCLKQFSLHNQFYFIERMVDVFIMSSLQSILPIFQTTITSPFDVIRLRLQNANLLVRRGSLDKPYSGMIDCASTIYKNEGIRAFWKGNGASLLKGFFSHHLTYGVRRNVKKLQKQLTGNKQLTLNMFFGGVAGLISTFLLYHFEYAKTRLVNDIEKVGKKKQFNGILDVYKKTYVSDGVAGLYRGFTISVSRIFVYRAFHFGIYDTFKPSVERIFNENIFFTFLLGWVSGVSAGFAAYPLDTISRRMMMTSCEKIKYKNFMECFKSISKKQGNRSLFSGYSVIFLQSSIEAILLIIYDQLTKDQFDR